VTGPQAQRPSRANHSGKSLQKGGMRDQRKIIHRGKNFGERERGSQERPERLSIPDHIFLYKRERAITSKKKGGKGGEASKKRLKDGE